MALIKCGECGREVSDKATACVGCGAPMASGASINATRVEVVQRKNSGCMTVIAIVGVLFISGAISKSCSGSDSSTTSSSASSVTPATSETPEQRAEQIRYLANSAENATSSALSRASAAESLVSKYGDSPEAARVKPLIAALKAQAEEESTNGPWRYNSYKDELTGKTVRTATIVSENTFSFEFPYNGAQNATLQLRQHPKYGTDAIVSIEKGQILCSSVGCPVEIRIDEGAVRKYEGNEPADNSSEHVFVPAYGALLKGLPGSKEVRIQFNVYQQGAPVAIFNTKGFSAERFKKGE